MLATRAAAAEQCSAAGGSTPTTAIKAKSPSPDQLPESGMETGYYSVQSILAESQTIQTKFLRKCPGIGYLDQENDDSEMAEGTQLRLPFWLARSLARREAAESTLPRHFRAGSGQFRSQLRMDPRKVNLHEKDPHFFVRGMQLSQMFDDDDLRKDLKDIFAERYKGTVDVCQHAADTEYSSSIRDLDQTERKLFDAGREGAKAYGQWKRGVRGQRTHFAPY